MLTPGRAVLYWTWTNTSAGAGDAMGPTTSTRNGTAITSPRREMPTDAANVTITLGVLLRRNLTATSTAASASWAALGLSEESEGMPGTDVAMLRGPSAEVGRKGLPSLAVVRASPFRPSTQHTQNGSFLLEDRFATWYAVPELDQTQVGE